MTDLDKIKTKIKKLFALSKSPNANEASIALEMAQKLMAECGVKRNDVGEFEIVEEKIDGNSGIHPPQYEIYLTGEIAKAFGCRIAYGTVRRIPKSFYGYDYHDPKYGHIFVGLEHRVKIASFIADVLLRKLKKARNEYMKKLNRVRLRANKIKRADDFCLGWAVKVISKLHEFSNTPDEQEAVDNYVADLDWSDDLKTISRKDIKRSGINDYVNGRRAAEDVQIQHGLEGKDAGVRLLEG
ncbi:MAG: DUF2786 domain-containing protein [Treponema sp.]|jgi:hypothetical protein|nr:DUF2786 domain-containing protein [Treponema sp.]